MRLSVRFVFVIAASVAGSSQAPLPQTFKVAVVSRDGTRRDIGALPSTIFAPRVSPDGQRIAFDSFDGAIWIADLSDLDSRKRVLLGRWPMWSGDGTRLLFAGPNGSGLFSQRADGSGAPETLAESARAPESWSDSANTISYITLVGADDYDVWALSIDSHRARPLIVKPATAQMGSNISPDGKWVAFESNESGTFEVYVAAVTETGISPPVQITRMGGRRPVWSRNQRTLFYDDNGSLLSVAIDTRGGVKAGEPVQLSVSGFLQGAARRQWDLLPDGEHFLMLFAR